MRRTAYCVLASLVVAWLVGGTFFALMVRQRLLDAVPAMEQTRGAAGAAPSASVDIQIGQVELDSRLPRQRAVPATAPPSMELFAPSKPSQAFAWVVNATEQEVRRELAVGRLDVREIDGRGRTALHWAARLGRNDLARLLMDGGADVNASDADAATPLHFLMDRLARPLGAGADAQERRSMQLEIAGGLPFAVDQLPVEYTRIATMLLDAGADPDARDVMGQTPLHMTANGGHIEIARLLLKVGADPTLRDNYGATPLDIARRNASSPDFLSVIEVGSRAWKPTKPAGEAEDGVP